MKALIFSVLLAITCCQQQDLKGYWALQKNKPLTTDYYPAMEFKSNGFVVLKSIGDTVYTGKYEQRDNKIILKIGKEETVIQVHKFTSEKMILSGFKNITDTLTYIKKNK
jgi:hypothetical protein